MGTEREISSDEVNIPRALAESTNDIGAKHEENERKVRVLSPNFCCKIRLPCCVPGGLVK